MEIAQTLGIFPEQATGLAAETARTSATVLAGEIDPAGAIVLVDHPRPAILVIF